MMLVLCVSKESRFWYGDLRRTTQGISQEMLTLSELFYPLREWAEAHLDEPEIPRQHKGSNTHYSQASQLEAQ